ncbi:hypothetical protein P3S68_016665 [Capsicum galapagoense]
MGNIKKQNLVITLLLLISFFFFLSSSSPSHEFQYSKNHGWSPSDNSNNNNVAPIVSPLYGDDHEYMIKNSEPPYFMKTQTGEGGGQGLMTTTKMKTKKKMKTRTLNLKNRERSSSDNWSSKRTYSAMLPKGFVPPSGSSPCHNTYPNSVAFFCQLSTTPKVP